MKRGGLLKRNKPPRRARPRVSTGKLRLEAELLSGQIAKAYARRQRHCQNPTCIENPRSPHYDPTVKKADWEAHHVTYEKHVTALGFPKWNTDNVLRLCVKCHARHHSRIAVLPLKMLRTENIEYAFRIMGERAFDYLQRQYAGADPRLRRMLDIANGTTTRY